jgi:predicted enzyme involved in methoxymalonyl-ACP biosynthesis
VRQGFECRGIEVRDRFGDYGLVGVMLFSSAAEALLVDTFLLSCRVLGRGVEHAMLRELGALAKERGLARVELPFVVTKKNQPARRFLDSLPAEMREADGGSDGCARRRAGCRFGLRPRDAIPPKHPWMVPQRRAVWSCQRL